MAEVLIPTTQTGSTQQTTTVSTTIPAESNPNPSSPSVDIVQRVSGVSPEKPASEVVPQESDILEGSGFDRNKWNEMLGKLPPEQKSQLESAYKALQTGAQKKFQKASELSKQAESTRRRPSVAELLQDPEFVKEAQAYAQMTQVQNAPANSGLTDEQWSVLSEQEKGTILSMQQGQAQLQTQMNRILTQQEDERIKQRYKNYDSSTVDQIQHDLISGKMQATREHLWKVLDYEDAVNRAYKLGLQDKNQNLTEKLNSSTSPSNFNITQADDVPTKQPNENSIDYFKRIASRRLSQFAGR